MKLLAATLMVLCTAFVNAQSQGAKVKKVMVDEIASFKATGDLKTKELDDGEKLWNVKLTLLPASDLENIRGEIKQTMNIFVEKGAEGKMEVERFQGNGLYAIYAIRSLTGTIMALVHDKYMVEVTAREFEALAEVRGVFGFMDFAALQYSIPYALLPCRTSPRELSAFVSNRYAGSHPA